MITRAIRWALSALVVWLVFTTHETRALAILLMINAELDVFIMRDLRRRVAALEKQLQRPFEYQRVDARGRRM